MKKMLICIDDEEVVLNSLEMELKIADADFEVETAMGGEEALELIDDLIKEGVEIAAVISDYIMPVMKGDEVLIKVHQKLPACATILLTGQSQIDGVTNAINNANLYRFIEKPWLKEDLLLTIKGAINKYDSEKQLKEQQQVIDDLNSRINDSRIEIVDSKVSEEQIFAHSLFARFFQSLDNDQKKWFGNACVGIMSADGRLTKSEMLYVNTLCTAYPDKEYVYHIVNLLKSRKKPKLDNPDVTPLLARKIMQFFVQLLVNDNKIDSNEQLYVQYIGGKLGLIEPVVNDFIKIAYQKIRLKQLENRLMVC